MSWQTILGMGSESPVWLVALLALVCIFGFVILPSAAVMAFLDAKFTADLQARIGPNRAGPAGMLQPLADLLKMLQKRASVRTGKSRWGEALWLAVHTMALYSTVAVLPLGSAVLLVDTDMSAFLPFWAALVLALGTMLLGLNQGTVPGWFGGVRVAAQTLAGAFPALIALLCAGVRSSSFRWSELAASQGSSPLGWAATTNPFQLLAFLVFMMSGLVLLNISPLDGGLSVPDIHGGVSSRLNGRRFSLFYLGRFYGFFLWSVIASVLFLGAWNLPEFVVEGLQGGGGEGVLPFLELAALLVKAFLLMIVVIWVARVNPRERSDQITDFSWKVLSPASLVALAGAAVWAGLRGMG